MKRLRENAACSVHADGQWLDCRALGVHDGTALLHPVSPRRLFALPDVVHGAELSFEDARGALVMLSGACVVDRRQLELRFVVTDGVQMPDPRGAMRVEVVLDVLAEPLGPDGAPTGERLTTRTVEVSATGMSIRAVDGLADTDAVAVELAIPDDQPPLRARFDVVRRTPEALHGRLQLSPEGALRLEVHLLDQRRFNVRRRAVAPAPGRARA